MPSQPLDDTTSSSTFMSLANQSRSVEQRGVLWKLPNELIDSIAHYSYHKGSIGDRTVIYTPLGTIKTLSLLSRAWANRLRPRILESSRTIILDSNDKVRRLANSLLDDSGISLDRLWGVDTLNWQCLPSQSALEALSSALDQEGSAPVRALKDGLTKLQLGAGFTNGFNRAQVRHYRKNRDDFSVSTRVAHTVQLTPVVTEVCVNHQGMQLSTSKGTLKPEDKDMHWSRILMSELSRLPTAQDNTLKLSLHGSCGVMLDQKSTLPCRKMFYDILNLRPSHVSNQAHPGPPIELDYVREKEREYSHKRLAWFFGIAQDTSIQEEFVDHAEVLLVHDPSTKRTDHDRYGVAAIPLKEEEIADTREQVAGFAGRLDVKHLIRTANKTDSCNVCATRDCEEYNNTFFGYWDSSDDEED